MRLEDNQGDINIQFNDGTTTNANGSDSNDNDNDNDNENSNDKYSNIDDLVKEFAKTHKFGFFCFFSFLCCLSKTRMYDKLYLYNRPYIMVGPLIIILFTILLFLWIFTRNDWTFNGLISNIIGILMIIPIIWCFEFYKNLLFFKDEKYGEKCFENETLTQDVENKKNEIEKLNNQCNELNSELLELRMTIAELQTPKNKTIDLREPGLLNIYVLISLLNMFLHMHTFYIVFVFVFVFVCLCYFFYPPVHFLHSLYNGICCVCCLCCLCLFSIFFAFCILYNRLIFTIRL